MLTRLRVKGFKNLLDVDVAFGPFTCIAGANAVGKSNLFDAITFLSDLTRYPILEAASRVRSPEKATDPQSLFFRNKNGPVEEMSFEADFIVPGRVVDNLHREAIPATKYLNYKLEFRYDEKIGIKHAAESLNAIDPEKPIATPYFLQGAEFRTTAVQGRRVSNREYIQSTRDDQGKGVLYLHNDRRRHREDVYSLPSDSWGYTVIGSIALASYPTVLAARREMESWRLLQLEPSALRLSDTFSSEPLVTSYGAHLPATLHRLGQEKQAEIAYRLVSLIPDLREVFVDVDDKRRLLTLFVRDRNGIVHSARSLSDGTLRFLALATIEADVESGGLVCLEEPEDGIYPGRIPAMLQLLKDMAVDPEYAVDADNPLRQVIINTHSPGTVAQVPADSLLMAANYRLPNSRGDGNTVQFHFVDGTWRNKLYSNRRTVAIGELISYLKKPTEAWDEDETPPDLPKTVGDLVDEALALFERQEDEEQAA